MSVEIPTAWLNEFKCVPKIFAVLLAPSTIVTEMWAKVNQLCDVRCDVPSTMPNRRITKENYRVGLSE